MIGGSDYQLIYLWTSPPFSTLLVQSVRGVQVDERLLLSGTSRTKAKPIERFEQSAALQEGFA